MGLTLASGASAASTVAQVGFDTCFIQRVQVLACAVALSIYLEDSGVAGHAARASYSRVFLGAPEVYAPHLAWAVVADLATNNDATDQEIVDRIEAVWNAVAGA